MYKANTFHRMETMKQPGAEEGINLAGLVRPQDRLATPEMLGFMQEILQTGSRVRGRTGRIGVSLLCSEHFLLDNFFFMIEWLD